MLKQQLQTLLLLAALTVAVSQVHATATELPKNESLEETEPLEAEILDATEVSPILSKEVEARAQNKSTVHVVETSDVWSLLPQEFIESNSKPAAEAAPSESSAKQDPKQSLQTEQPLPQHIVTKVKKRTEFIQHNDKKRPYAKRQPGPWNYGIKNNYQGNYATVSYPNFYNRQPMPPVFAMSGQRPSPYSTIPPPYPYSPYFPVYGQPPNMKKKVQRRPSTASISPLAVPASSAIPQLPPVVFPIPDGLPSWALPYIHHAASYANLKPVSLSQPVENDYVIQPRPSPLQHSVQEFALVPSKDGSYTVRLPPSSLNSRPVYVHSVSSTSPNSFSSTTSITSKRPDNAAYYTEIIAPPPVRTPAAERPQKKRKKHRKSSKPHASPSVPTSTSSLTSSMTPLPTTTTTTANTPGPDQFNADQFQLFCSMLPSICASNANIAAAEIQSADKSSLPFLVVLVQPTAPTETTYVRSAN